MIKSNRSKRRKTQEELRTIYNIYSNTNADTNLTAKYSTNSESLQIPSSDTQFINFTVT